MRIILLTMLALIVAGCGVQRPLIRPSEIPAYEKQQREKRDRIEQEKRELEAIDTKRAAERKTVVTPVPESAN